METLRQENVKMWTQCCHLKEDRTYRPSNQTKGPQEETQLDECPNQHPTRVDN